LLLIFDWDGTLSNSASKIIACVQKAAETTGFPVLEDDVIRNIIGLGLPEAMQRLYPLLSDNEREQIRQGYVDHFLSSDQTPSPFFDGVIEGLQNLKSAGFTMAVATGKSRRGLDRVLKDTGMQACFDGSRCADETASKPHPLMLHELLAEFTVPPERAIMIGDTEYDMDMAQRASVPRVAVSYGAHHIDRLVTYDPVLRVDQFTDFVTWALQSR
jgi:phosphoglycolate phosphatase